MHDKYLLPKFPPRDSCFLVFRHFDPESADHQRPVPSSAGLADGGIFPSKWYDFAMLWVWAFFYRACFVLLIRARDIATRYRQKRK
jgi:hypothetical protein